MWSIQQWKQIFPVLMSCVAPGTPCISMRSFVQDGVSPIAEDYADVTVVFTDALPQWTWVNVEIRAIQYLVDHPTSIVSGLYPWLVGLVRLIHL